MPGVPSLDELMAQARDETGLDDFGPPSFRVGFERYLQSLAEDAKLTDAALAGVLATQRRRLVNRLRIEAWYAQHPEIADVPVEGPVSITGIPRSGTTALADMMSLDPQFRPLRGWEQAAPCPPPILADEAIDPRRIEALRSHETMLAERAEAMAVHIYEVDATTEDADLLGIDGRTQGAPVPVTGYHVWWREQSMRDTYRYHQRVAQLLQSRRPPNYWLFKAPHMSFHLEDFVAAYPDARFVMTHRDPVKAVPSWASLVTSLFPPGARETTDMHAYGRHLAEHLAYGTRRSIEARATLGDDRFLDIHHHEFAADAMGTIERVYTWLGRTLNDDVRSAMATWSEANKVGAHGVHRYTLEQFGLDAATIRAQFAEYTNHFGVHLEV
jgi:hypothetical protein